MGRIRAAISVLLGRQQTYPQIQAEWAEMKADWLAAFDKLNALVARMAKERKRLTEAIAESHGVGEQQQEQMPQSREEMKQELRRQALGTRAGPMPGPGANGPPEAAQGLSGHGGVGQYVPEDEIPEEEET